MKKFILEKTDIPVKGINSRVKAVLIGDIHESAVDIEKMSAAILNERPDVIFFTGDMMDRHKISGDVFVSLLIKLGSGIPMFMCPGNHESFVRENYEDKYNDFIDKITSLGVKYLSNESCNLIVKGTRLCIVGTDPYICDKFIPQEQLGKPEKECATVALTHNPNYFKMLEKWGANIVLSGHVHGGVVRLPIFGGVLSPKRCFFPHFSKGVYAKNNSVLFVTSGISGLTSNLNYRIFNPRTVDVLVFRRYYLGFEERKFKAFRIICALVFSVLAAMGFISIFFGLYGIWSLLSFLGFSAAACYCVLDNDKIIRLRTNIFSSVIIKLSKIALLLLMLVSAFCLCLIWKANASVPGKGDTLIVLGCQTKDDQPSMMLKDRLDVAYEYLCENGDAFCVVTGGKGEDEKYSEGEIMKKYLVDLGIDGDRIFVESTSVNTYENIYNAKKIIDENGLSHNVAIASDRFHQWRASEISKKLGLSYSAVGCRTRWYYAEPMYIREYCAILKYLIIGFE